MQQLKNDKPIALRYLTIYLPPLQRTAQRQSWHTVAPAIFHATPNSTATALKLLPI